MLGWCMLRVAIAVFAGCSCPPCGVVVSWLASAVGRSLPVVCCPRPRAVVRRPVFWCQSSVAARCCQEPPRHLMACSVLMWKRSLSVCAICFFCSFPICIYEGIFNRGNSSLSMYRHSSRSAIGCLQFLLIPLLWQWPMGVSLVPFGPDGDSASGKYALMEENGYWKGVSQMP